MKILRVCLVIAAVLGFSHPVEACRFTVREIAYSILSQTKFSLVIIDKNKSIDTPAIQEISSCEKYTNMNVVLLNPETDRKHPFFDIASTAGLDLPAYFLLAPNNTILPLEQGRSLSDKELKETFQHTILNSTLRNQFLDHAHASFARVLLIHGNDAEQNKEAAAIIRDNCMQIKDLMPLMPKEIQTPPSLLEVTREQFKKEKVFLWSLGLDTLQNEPRAVVLYGRGRLMGQPLSYPEIKKGGAYKYMTLIGADCECGIDRKWMLGRQGLLKWDLQASQQLATELGFDVDSPSILAEMSRIIAKEIDEENVNTISFGPENINVDLAFGLNHAPEDEVDDDDDSLFYIVLFGSLGILVVLILMASVWYWKHTRQ